MPGPEGIAGGEVEPNPSPSTPAEKIDSDFITEINQRLAEYRESMDATKIRNGLATLMLISSRGNLYLQESGLDNSLLANQPERCGEVLLNAINLIYLLSVLVQPFMPTTSSDILRQLNAPARSLPTRFSIDILPGHTLNKAEYLFKKIDNVDGAQEKKWQRQFGGDAVVAEKVTPAGPGGHAEGGAVPKVSDVIKNSKKEQHDARLKELARLKKLAAAEAEKNKSPEERDLEARLDAQGKLVAALRTGKADGDVAVETAKVKDLKAELAELRKKLKEASIA